MTRSQFYALDRSDGVYRFTELIDGALVFAGVACLGRDDELSSPLLPGFAVRLATLLVGR